VSREFGDRINGSLPVNKNTKLTVVKLKPKNPVD